MNEINKINLSEKTKFWLSQIIGIENYFHHLINQRKSSSKKLSKYVTTFDYIDKNLIALSTISSAVCIISIASVVEVSTRRASTSLTFIFSITTGIIKELKRKCTIRFLCCLKVNSIALKLSIPNIDWHGNKPWRI